ncbi:PAP2 family protein [Teladorsagia circumcincta]|uniref:PAP2 family protein n=1 Tax=Teladorsagia circumcincta TaxID=45464 RepID=A0A2G9V331_TELCI|nr:PAP2 family protein [Teladorsagia circumcincta]
MPDLYPEKALISARRKRCVCGRAWSESPWFEEARQWLSGRVTTANMSDTIRISRICKNPDLYITNFTCTGGNEKLILESQLSFYSGHSAFSFYGAWFTSLYLQARLYRPLFSRLLLPVIQFSLFGGASYVALTRVSDYKHHWSDVLVGALIGSAIGIFTALYVAEVFKRREIPACVLASDEFGLIRMEKRSDVVPPAVTTATHSITVTNEQDPSSNQRLLAYCNSSEAKCANGEYLSEIRLDPMLVVKM